MFNLQIFVVHNVNPQKKRIKRDKNNDVVGMKISLTVVKLSTSMLMNL